MRPETKPFNALEIFDHTGNQRPHRGSRKIPTVGFMELHQFRSTGRRHLSSIDQPLSGKRGWNRTGFGRGAEPFAVA